MIRFTHVATTMSLVAALTASWTVQATAQRGMPRGGYPGNGGRLPPPPGRDVPDTTARAGARPADAPPEPTTDDVRIAQRDFERYRRYRLREEGPSRPNGECDDTIGNFCYWYDPTQPPPPAEDPAIGKARDRLRALLDSVAVRLPGERWIAGQRVRYALDANKLPDAERAARECQGSSSWCAQLVGLALHEGSRYAAAESAFAVALGRMTPLERCRWGEVSQLLDETLRGRYRNLTCEQKQLFEDRFWWLARPFYGLGPNDARTEFHARLTMAQVLDGSATPYQFAFSKDEREMVIRYGWSRAWTKATVRGPGPYPQETIVGHETVPAYPFSPATGQFDYPGRSDSGSWSPDFRPALARYGPAYAKTIAGVRHQLSLFRRGDTALVVAAWDMRSDTNAARGPLDATLVLADSQLHTGIASRQGAGPTGMLSARAPWGNGLMSLELRDPSHEWTARARYGVMPPYAIGARVTLSDLLIFTPSGELPQTLDEAAPKAMGAIRVRASEKLGLFWEMYGVSAAGEQATVSITVIRENDEPGFFARQARRLRLMQSEEPVTVRIGEQTTPGVNRASRSVTLDISTLSKGTYRLELELEVPGQYAVRAERVIEVTGK